MLNRRMRKTARTVVWEGAEPVRPRPDTARHDPGGFGGRAGIWWFLHMVDDIATKF